MRVFVDGMEVDPTKPFSNPSRPAQPGVIDGEFREIEPSSGNEPPEWRPMERAHLPPPKPPALSP